ncbi:MAG TPA: hypothetical protein VNH15_04820 [Elusimicrobiota bacterium]|nr:hypothetical protein [Elusimicrobiota bacterium]
MPNKQSKTAFGGLKSPWLFLLPLAAFIVLRFPLLRLPPFGDEEMFVRQAANLGAGNPAGYPVLGFLILRGGFFFLGWNHLRWVPFLFSLGVFALTAFIGEDFMGFGGAYLAAWLLALSPLSVSVSPQILMDGSFVAFFFLAFLLLYKKSLRVKEFQPWTLIACGVLFGCLWMTSYAAFALASGVGLYALLRAGVKRTLRDFSLIGPCGAAVFALYPLLAPGSYKLSTHKLGLFHSAPVIAHLASQPWLFVSSWAKAVIFVGPLLLWGLARALVRREGRQSRELLLSACLCYMLLLLVFINPDRTMDYWSPVLPLLCVLAAGELLSWGNSLRWRDIPPWAAAYWIALGILTASGPHAVFAVHPMRYAPKFWLEFFPVRMFYGPSLGCYFRPAALIASFAGLAALWLFTRRFPAARTHLAALGLAYGLFYSLEYAHPLFSPNLNNAGARMLAEFQARPPTEPLYLHGYSAMACEKSGIPAQPFMYAGDVIANLIPAMERTGGTLALADAPAIGPDSPLRELLARDAELKESFSDDGVALVQVWSLKKSAAR